ncbi:hypothetical protein [Nocardiopsis sp. NRRL B-16309]|uniref:hypothetical protein n=1 Tax=Nocardiopsis sp. NRRL B-16309 TaxID=1519494 RepID=UPI000AE446F6|nr:hypothetical protein [Nocardiopsis sp. NRRL B-16309]
MNTSTAPAVHLLAALIPDRHLAAQVRVSAGTNEIDALPFLLEGLYLADVVVTADALHTWPNLLRIRSKSWAPAPC